MPVERFALAFCPKSRQRSNSHSRFARQHASGVIRACALAGNTPAKQFTLALYPKSRQQGNSHSRFARNCASEAKCVCALSDNTSAERFALARCPKTRQRSNSRLHVTRNYTSEAKCICALHGNTPAKRFAPALYPKSRQQSRESAFESPRHAKSSRAETQLCRPICFPASVSTNITGNPVVRAAVRGRGVCAGGERALAGDARTN